MGENVDWLLRESCVPEREVRASVYLMEVETTDSNVTIWRKEREEGLPWDTNIKRMGREFFTLKGTQKGWREIRKKAGLDNITKIQKKVR